MTAAGEKRDQTDTSPYQFKASAYGSHIRVLRSFPSDGRGRRLLDLGCGGGEISSMLAEAGYQVTAVDRNPPARADLESSVKFLAADLDDGLPQLPGRFDFVLCADILEHLREPARLLADVRAVLAPGGLLVASLPNSGHWYFRLNVAAGRFPADDHGLFDRTHLHFYTWDGWVRLFAGTGFRIDKVTPAAVPVGRVLPRWEHTPIVRGLEAGGYALARLWKKLFAYQFIVAARPKEEA